MNLPPFDPARLRALRGHRTPEQMDKLCRLAPGVWARAEQDGASVNLYGRAAIRDALGVDYADLCTDTQAEKEIKKEPSRKTAREKLQG